MDRLQQPWLDATVKNGAVPAAMLSGSSVPAASGTACVRDRTMASRLPLRIAGRRMPGTASFHCRKRH